MKILITILLASIFLNHAYSQNEIVLYNKFNSGIPSDTVNAFAIDKNGNKWIGTYKGLVKFDGKNWVKYDSTNSNFYYSNPIIDIKVDHNDNILVGCWGNINGLNFFDGKKWKFINGGRGFVVINSIAVDSQNTIWIGSNAWDGGTGLGKISGDSIKVYTEWEKYIPANDIRAIAIDKDNIPWIATWRNNGLGLTKFDKEKPTTFTTANSELTSNNITVINPDIDGSLWIGTEESGINIFKNGKCTKYSTDNSKLPNNSISAIIDDGFGTKWIGTKGGGLVKFKDGIWTTYNGENSNIPNNINAIYMDTKGCLWILANIGLICFKIPK